MELDLKQSKIRITKKKKRCPDIDLKNLHVNFRKDLSMGTLQGVLYRKGSLGT